MFVLLLFAAGAGLYRRVRELELAVYQGIGQNLVGTNTANALQPLATKGKTTVIVKVNRRCPVCDDLLGGVARIAPGLGNSIQLTVLSDDPQFGKPLPENVRVVKDADAWRALTVPYVPAVVVVSADGVVLHTEPGGSVESFEATVERAATIGKETVR
ncbi:hypothetical protein [Micromonospora craterilacus]|uniref:hypothetical protein n=1 Tax=Micromonospora craterilacus TaxID=1655439 RepID=UPI0011B4AC4B|nr:hypothetical protein [Micromonospora craterilacus]